MWLHDGEPQAEAAVRARAALARLLEVLERVGQEVRADPDALVVHAQAGLLSVRLDAHLHRAALAAELHGVGGQVPDHLLQPLGIREHADRPGPQVHRQVDAAPVRRGAHGVEPLLHHRAQVDRRRLHPELAGHDARDVEQVVDQLRLQARVALDHLERVRHLSRRHLLVAQHRGPAQDRRERRAQLVRERRQELVLELVVALGGLASLLLAHQLEAGLLGQLAEGDVAREQVDEAFLPEGGGGPRQPAVAAVGVAAAVLEARGGRALHEIAQLVEQRLAVVRVQEVDDRARAQLVVREAEAALPARVQLEQAALEVCNREEVRGQREEAVAPRLEVEPVGGFRQALGVLALLAQPPPLRLLADLLPPPVQLDEHRDLRPQHLGLDGELDVVDGPQRVAARHPGLELAHRGHEDDRRLLRAGPPADQAGGLEAVELRHVDVEQDHRELVAQERAQRLVPGARGGHLHADVRQDRLERQQLVGAVVDQQHVHGRGRFLAQCDVSGMGHLQDRFQRWSQLRSCATRWSASTGFAM